MLPGENERNAKQRAKRQRTADDNRMVGETIARLLRQLAPNVVTFFDERDVLNNCRRMEQEIGKVLLVGTDLRHFYAVASVTSSNFVYYTYLPVSTTGVF